MVNGWRGVALEITRIRSFVIFHLKNWFMVKTRTEKRQWILVASVFTRLSLEYSCTSCLVLSMPR
jgi:hypothetical protein